MSTRTRLTATAFTGLLLLAGCSANGGGNAGTTTTTATTAASTTSTTEATTTSTTEDTTTTEATTTTSSSGTALASVTDAPSGITFGLPGPITKTSRDLTTGAGTLTVRFYASGSLNTATTLASVYDLKGRPFSLDGAVKGAASNVSGTITKQTPLTVDGRDAIDAEVSITQGATKGLILLRVINVNANYSVAIQALGNAGQDAAVRARFAAINRAVKLP